MEWERRREKKGMEERVGEGYGVGEEEGEEGDGREIREGGKRKHRTTKNEKVRT